MNKYLVTIASVENDEFVTYAFGEFPTINFAAKAGLKEISDKPGDFSGRVVEVENIGEADEKRTVVSVQGDAETVAVVMKRKLANERKEYRAATGTDAPETDSDDTAE